jgi:hypothetical protein
MNPDLPPCLSFLPEGEDENSLGRGPHGQVFVHGVGE